jgi:hypothetical protein
MSVYRHGLKGKAALLASFGSKISEITPAGLRTGHNID